MIRASEAKSTSSPGEVWAKGFTAGEDQSCETLGEHGYHDAARWLRERLMAERAREQRPNETTPSASALRGGKMAILLRAAYDAACEGKEVTIARVEGDVVIGPRTKPSVVARILGALIAAPSLQPGERAVLDDLPDHAASDALRKLLGRLGALEDGTLREHAASCTGCSWEWCNVARAQTSEEEHEKRWLCRECGELTLDQWAGSAPDMVCYRCRPPEGTECKKCGYAYVRGQSGPTCPAGFFHSWREDPPRPSDATPQRCPHGYLWGWCDYDVHRDCPSRGPRSNGSHPSAFVLATRLASVLNARWLDGKGTRCRHYWGVHDQRCVLDDDHPTNETSTAGHIYAKHAPKEGDYE